MADHKDHKHDVCAVRKNTARIAPQPLRKGLDTPSSEQDKTETAPAGLFAKVFHYVCLSGLGEQLQRLVKDPYSSNASGQRLAANGFIG